MNRKKRHLYFLIGMTLVMLLLVQVFIDDILTDYDTSKTANSSNRLQQQKMQQARQKDYRRIAQITIDKDKISLNAGDNRYLYTRIQYDGQKDLPDEPLVWESSDPSVATVNQNGVVTGIEDGEADITLYSDSRQVSAVCHVSVKPTRYVAMTFDDGPGPYTQSLLNALNTYHCKATFFIVGYNLENYPNELKEASNSFMEIGNHTYHHKNLADADKKTIQKEINSNRDLIYEITGAYPTLLRPPYGVKKAALRKCCDVPIILWSVDTEDWSHQNVRYIRKYLLGHLGDGEIILMHDIHEKSVKAMIQTLPEIINRGYELVTVSELYQIKGMDLTSGQLHYSTNLPE